MSEAVGMGNLDDAHDIPVPFCVIIIVTTTRSRLQRPPFTSLLLAEFFALLLL